jgi:hypothetical protein
LSLGSTTPAALLFCSTICEKVSSPRSRPQTEAASRVAVVGLLLLDAAVVVDGTPSASV